MTGTLLVAALGLFALGAVVDLGLGAGRRLGRVLPGVTGAIGALIGVAAGGLGLASGRVFSSSLRSVLEIPGAGVRVDHLSALFLVIALGVGGPAAAAMALWAWPEGRLEGRGAGAGLSMVLGSTVVVLVAGDAFTFLFGWETLTVGFVVLTGWSRRTRAQAASTWVTGAVGKVSGAALLVGFLLLASASHSLDLGAWAAVRGGALRDAAWGLVVVGFGAKVGLVPFQVWQPLGYPSAPGPSRAVMAGAAVNVGFYGLWRMLGVLGAPPDWLVVAVLVLGGAGALLGIVFASVEGRLARLLAFSSIENAGIILVGFGVAMAGASVHEPELVAAGLLAATVAVIAHALGKTTAFTAASFADLARGGDELERLRGLGRDRPWAASTLGLAAASLAGLPPMVGFVSEWLVLETLMQEFRVHELAVRVAMVLAGAAVALTAGIAVATFARVLGLVLLGRDPGRAGPERAGTDGRGGRRGAPAGVLGAGAALLGLVGTAAVAPWVVRLSASGLAPVVGERTVLGALEEPWVLEPVYKGFSVLSPSWLVVVLPVGILAVGAMAWALSGGRLLRWRRVPAWRSASGTVGAPSAYSTFGYANPLRHVFANVLGAERSVLRDGAGESGGGQTVVETGIREPTVAFVYRPLSRAWVALAKLVRRGQSGRLEAYVAYMLAALVALLALVALMH